MRMNTKTKILLGSTLLASFVFVLLFSYPLITKAETNISELYANPNQSSGNNPYQLKLSDVVSSGLLQQVVGCTGVVNKVSTWMMKFVQSPAKQAEIMAGKIQKHREMLIQGCSSTKAVAEGAAGATPTVNDLTSAVKTKFSSTRVGGYLACVDQVNATDDKVLAAQVKANEADAEDKVKEQCLDGIAITLAKNQLTAMTRSAVNWVNSGYGGNPFYIQNMNNFTNNTNKSLLTQGVLSLINQDKAYPFGSDFSRTAIRIYKTRNGSPETFLDSLTSDLGAFITDPDGYNGSLSALERAKRANETFAKDFSSGGWNGWLALTQRDQNNPLGFTMQVAQHQADEQAKKEASVTNELNRNGGFLDQKVCTKWQIFDNEGKPLTQPDPSYYLSGEGNFYMPENIEPKTTYVYRSTKSSSGYDVCASDGWKTLTPGGVIKEKTISYLNSPERQLELADTINESLNALFSILISKLQGSGLSGLSDSVVTTNWTDTMNEFDDDSSPYNNNGAYGGFNLTRDLGNTFIHENVYRAGTWDARSNINLTTPGNHNLIMGYAPSVYNTRGDLVSSNLYYTVTNSGDTRLIENGFNFWEVGDRAFWNGYEWQNWKCGPLVNGKCTNQVSPIKKRGVVQIQKDYIVAAKEILKVLPNIVPKMGELDYCLPGPNPNYQMNSMDTQSAYQEWIGSLYVGQKDENRFGWRIDDESSRTYKNFASIFDDNKNTWKKIRESIGWWLLDGGFGNGGYVYNPNKDQMADLDKHRKWADKITDYVNNHLFQNFYESFDKIVDKVYYKSSTSKYLERENSSVLKDNPAYIEMAETGYGMTKDILYYDNDIEEISQQYRDAISQTQINISKLETIKYEVSGIILAAQARRDANLVKILNEETTRVCNSNYALCMSNGFGLTEQEAGRPLERGQLCSAKQQICLADTLTEAEYKTKYAQCLDEENIEFYDPDEMLNPNFDTERCFNSIDDDLDGLVDTKDPDCEGVTGGGNTGGNTGNETSGICSDAGTSISPNPYGDPGSGDECSYYENQSSCNGSTYTRDGMEGGVNIMTTYTCQWFTLN